MTVATFVYTSFGRLRFCRIKFLSYVLVLLRLWDPEKKNGLYRNSTLHWHRINAQVIIICRALCSISKVCCRWFCCWFAHARTFGHSFQHSSIEIRLGEYGQYLNAQLKLILTLFFLFDLQNVGHILEIGSNRRKKVTLCGRLLCSDGCVAPILVIVKHHPHE